MNIHHLELYYYVARHGGVSAAARKIPYGIQQPAISEQIIQLEKNLGTALFLRRPFKLTPAGEELYRYIEPFFSGLDGIGRRLRGGADATLRIGALETVLREYVPRLLLQMRQRMPKLSFTLIPSTVHEIERLLVAQEIDVGISPLLGPRAPGVRQRVMLQVPMVLLVPSKSRLRSPVQLWEQDRIADPLVTWTADNPVCRLFQAELQKRKVEWFPSIELTSQELIARYVSEGFGIGVMLAEPGLIAPKGVRVLPLVDFPKVPYGLLWTGEGSPLLRIFAEEAEQLAQTLGEAGVKPPGKKA